MRNTCPLVAGNPKRTSSTLSDDRGPLGVVIEATRYSLAGPAFAFTILPVYSIEANVAYG